MFQIGQQVKVLVDSNPELPAGSTAEILNVHSGEYPFELLGSFQCFAGDELELVA